MSMNIGQLSKVLQFECDQLSFVDFQALSGIMNASMFYYLIYRVMALQSFS